MTEFVKNLDDLLYIASKKVNITRYLHKNYKENIHYIKQKSNIKCNGGQNKIIYMLTESAFELLKNSYNLRNKYIVNISDTIKTLNPSVLKIKQ